MEQELIRPKFILSTAVGLALAIVIGYPVGGWVLSNAEPRGRQASVPAFYLAKAGVDRGLFQINKRRANLQSLIDGKSVAGLNDDQLFSEVPGGAYTVKARYDKAAREFHIRGTGFDAKTGEKRSIELVLKQQSDEKGLLQVIWKEVPTES